MYDRGFLSSFIRTPISIYMLHMKNLKLQTQGGLSQLNHWLPESHSLTCLQLCVPGPSIALLTFVIGLAFPSTHVLKWLNGLMRSPARRKEKWEDAAGAVTSQGPGCQQSASLKLPWIQHPSSIATQFLQGYENCSMYFSLETWNQFCFWHILSTSHCWEGLLAKVSP